MRLVTRKNQTRDGELCFVDPDLKKIKPVGDDFRTMQAMLDNWQLSRENLLLRYEAFIKESASCQSVDLLSLTAPLPRAFQWLDGSAYVHHVELARKARGASMPENFWVEPLMYQGASDTFSGPYEPYAVLDEAYGLDFEAEIGVITDDVPMGVSVADAGKHICFLVLINDWSFRELIPAELQKGFGFVNGKPSTSFAPIAISPHLLNRDWINSQLHAKIKCNLNDQMFGMVDSGVDMVFSFTQLIAHAAKTRKLCAGTIIGSGTVSNRDSSKGSCCLLEKRMLEILEKGKPITPYLKKGDRVLIQAIDSQGKNIFGNIEQLIKG